MLTSLFLILPAQVQTSMGRRQKESSHHTGYSTDSFSKS